MFLSRERGGWAASVALLCLSLVVPASAVSSLPDNRGWELVSPPEKNGGRVAPPGSIAGGGVLQAAAQGSLVTFSSATSFASGAGAPPGSQYLSARSASGWSTENLTTPLLSGTYDTDDGVPYRLFSTDLALGMMLNGDHCRGEETSCPVENPPLPGSGAPTGFQNYYLRSSSTGAFTALLGSVTLSGHDADEFEVSFAGASPDLAHVVLSSCAALTANATEVSLGGGCDPAKPNLYLWSSGKGLSLVNLLPAQGAGSPGARVAAQSTAISQGGGRVYWEDLASGNLYLREGATTKQVDTAAGGGGSFQTASADGSIAFFVKGGHLWRYSGESSADLTPAGGVQGVLGASADGSYVYFQDAVGLKLWHGGTTTMVASGPAATLASDYPPTTGTARVSADGAHLLFLSKAALTGYDNTDKATGLADSEVFLYDADAASLTCVSCNPSNVRPIGPSTIPGSVPNGTTTNAYKPRVLSANARRVFFDSEDALLITDTNSAPDVYQWEAQGEGSCSKAGGCISLISDGREAEGSTFADASVDGSDAFFLTEASLVSADPGSLDLYDARVGGGFPEPLVPLRCEGDSCQVLPSEPVDPTLTTLLNGLGNPKVQYARYKRREAKQPKRGHKRCKQKKARRGCRGKRGGRR